MTESPKGSHPAAAARHSPLWLAGSLLLAALQSVHSLCYPLGRDQALYCFYGLRLWEGKRLYVDLWDIKPPGIFYLYALIVKVFGSVMWSVGVVDLLWVVVISCFIFKFAERYFGTFPAVIAVAFHAAWRARLGYWDAGQADNFLMLLVMAAYFLSSYRGNWKWPLDFLSGVLFGAAFWLKYNALVFLPLLVIVPYLDCTAIEAGRRLPRFRLSAGEWLKRVGAWATAFAATVAGVLGYLHASGAWRAMKEIQFQVLPRYNAMVLERSRHYGHYASGQIGAGVGWWLLLAAILAVLVAWRTRHLGATLPVILAAGMGTVCTATQSRLPSYAFETCYPFFAMLWGFLGVQVFHAFLGAFRWCRRRQWRLAAVLVWVVFANLVYLPLPGEALQFKLYAYDLREWWHDRDSFYRNFPWGRPISHFDGAMPVIQYLRTNSNPQDGVFVWGADPVIYFLSDRNPPTRFATNLALDSPWAPSAWRDELMHSLDAAPPRYIVVVRDDAAPLITFSFLDSETYLQLHFPALLRLVTSDYHKVGDYNGYAIFRRDVSASQ